MPDSNGPESIVHSPPLEEIVLRGIPRLDGAMLDLWGEFLRQDEKWGRQDHDDLTWAAILLEEIDEACSAIDEDNTALGSEGTAGIAWALAHARTGGGCARDYLADIRGERNPERPAPDLSPSALRTELIQVAAVAIQWAACISRRSAPPSEPAEVP